MNNKGETKMRKQNAFNKFQEEKASNQNWINVLSGNNPIIAEPSEYGVKMSTFRKQARKAGFKTAIFNCEEVLIYRGNCI